MAFKRSRFTIELTVETTELNDEEHDRRARWIYRNMSDTNGDIKDAFYVVVIRDEQGNLVEFKGSGRGKPSDDVKELMEDLMNEVA